MERTARLFIQTVFRSLNIDDTLMKDTHSHTHTSLRLRTDLKANPVPDSVIEV